MPAVELLHLLDNEVYIAAAARTPHGSYRGSLSHLSATQLGSHAIKGALDRVPQIAPEHIDELFVGNVLSANLGQNPAKQCAIGAGLPASVICTSVNKVCSSGLKAVTLGAQTIVCRHADTVVAGGTESMTNCPLYFRNVTKPPAVKPPVKLKAAPPAPPVSGVVRDGLTDSFGTEEVMGLKADRTARRHDISRQAQDAAALDSYRKMTMAYSDGWMDTEIAPIALEGSNGSIIEMMDRDEPLAKFPLTTLSSLKPAFDPVGGSVTAGNTSSMCDGAAAVVLISGARASELHVRPLARVVDWADAEVDPEDFIMAPALAIERVLRRSGTESSMVGVYEINEAFAVSALSNMAQLGISPDRVNLHGGSLAIGHPLGASGCRILVSLLTAMRARGSRLGCASVCNGGGGATAILVELI